MRSRMKGVFWSGIFPLFLWTFVSGQSSCPIETNRTELQTPYEKPTKLTLNSAFMSPIVHSFLDSVQPNPFPKGKLMWCSFHLLLISCSFSIKEFAISSLVTNGFIYANNMLCGTDESNLIWDCNGCIRLIRGWY